MSKSECHQTTNKQPQRQAYLGGAVQGTAEVGRARRLEVGVSEVEAGQEHEVRDGGEKHASP